jgi:hypothetical protein
MAVICIAGESGTGKSTSVGQIPELGIKGLSPRETVYINVAKKDLPFRGWKKKYTGEVSKGGNYLESSNPTVIAQAIKYISQKRDDIQNIVIDDCQYIMAFEFMARAKEVGYQKFSDIGVHMSDILAAAKDSRKNVFFMWHPELDEKTEFKLKSVGKMLDNYFNPQGLFTIVLYSKAEKDGDNVNYVFVTNKDGMYPAKSPVGMFEKQIPNDLGYVVDKINEYNNAE